MVSILVFRFRIAIPVLNQDYLWHQDVDVATFARWDSGSG
jgi:hypothetical protein